MKLNGADR